MQSPSFKYDVLARFLCAHHNVSDVPHIEPFRGCVHGWDVMRETVLGVKASASVDFDMSNASQSPESQVVTCAFSSSKLLNDPQPRNKFKHPISGDAMAADLSKICIYNITFRWYRSSVSGGGSSVAMRMGSVSQPHQAMGHGPWNEFQNTAGRNRAFEAAGAVSGAFTALAQTGPEGRDANDVPFPNLAFGYQNKQFTQTMALITKNNLMNGIIAIPPDVCTAAGLSVWRDDAQPSIDIAAESLASFKRSTFYYAVPINHVLAWGYQSREYREKRDHKVEDFYYVHPTSGEHVLLYYLAKSADLEAAREGFCRDMLGKVDVRPLEDIAIQFLPRYAAGQPPRVQGTIDATVYISYFSAPTMSAATVDALAPVLCLDFPPCEHWDTEESALQMAAEEESQSARGAGGKWI